MPATHAELLVRAPHLLVADRLPPTSTAGDVTLSLTGAVGVVPVVGSLSAHVAEAGWRRNGRGGGARVEVVRGGTDRTLLTVVVDGLPTACASALAEELRRQVLAAEQRPAPSAHPVRPAAVRSA